MVQGNPVHHLSVLFGSQLRRLRQARGWSQEYLAGVADINRSFVGEIERGDAVPSLETLGKLAAALDLSVSALLVGIDDRRGAPNTMQIDGDSRLNDQ